MSHIDSRAVVSSRVRLGRDVRIEAFAVVGDDVELGDGCILRPHAFVNGPGRYGRGNLFHPFCSVGGDPQDFDYHGEKTELVAGDENIFHEFVTVNRGTVKGGGVTRVGSHNLFLTQAHVGHDCVVGDHTLFVNGATLAGHVVIEDHAAVGAYSAVHQFCRVGKHAYIGGFTVVTQDVPPFATVVTPRDTKCYGANSIGLERRGFSEERIAAIEQAYKLLLRSKLNTTQALEQMRQTLNGQPDVEELIRFIQAAERGITK